MEDKHDSKKQPHAILVPLPLQGHVIPFTHLALKLASKGFTITFVNTQFIHHQITKSQTPNITTTQDQDHDDDDIFATARNSGLDIRYKTVSDGFPVAFNRLQNLDQFLDQGHLHVLPAHVDELVGDLVQSDPSITCFIADTFHTWPATIAAKYNLVHVSFWSQPALVFNIYYHLDLLTQNGHFGSHDNSEDIIDYIPGVQSIEPKDLMSHLQTSDLTAPMLRIIFKAFHEVKRADFILINTVQELEFDSLSALQDKQPTYAIGPLFPNEPTKSMVATNLMSEFECTQWLSTKPSASVLFISFGSYTQVTKSEIEEIANGLLLSEVSFIWVLRPDATSYDEINTDTILPVGFEYEIKDRGLIVPWCSQIEVLSHQAIGGFLTHCGWNSILESMWCGVPMLCFPLWTDQITNRKLVVDDWGIGLNICDRVKPVTRAEVAEKISRLISGKCGGDGLQKEIKKVSQTLKDALALNGSSHKNFSQFITDLKAKIHIKELIN